MLLSTPGLVLHTVPYAETSVVAKVFTRQLGVRSYIIKGVRGGSSCSRVRQNLLQPLSNIDMVVYDNHRSNLNYVKELTPRQSSVSDPVGNALRFFMTEVLYKVLREEEPMPELWDYVEKASDTTAGERKDVPIRFLLMVARHLGIEPMDNYSSREPYFCLEEGRYVSAPNETTLPSNLSMILHEYLLSSHSQSLPVTPSHSLQSRRDLIDALIAYFQFHLSGFKQFRSHEILHTILK